MSTSPVSVLANSEFLSFALAATSRALHVAAREKHPHGDEAVVTAQVCVWLEAVKQVVIEEFQEAHLAHGLMALQAEKPVH